MYVTASNGRRGGVSIVQVTHRREPAFAWLADSLAAQLQSGDDVEVILVDGLHAPERSAQLARIVADRFPFRHVPPKPTPWNGPHRLTTRDYWAVSSARNTGIVYATKPYVVFVDDITVLGESWWQQVKAAAGEGIVVAGAYRKCHGMVVREGRLVSSRLERIGLDCRWERGDDRESVPIGGGELFGNGIGAPRELLIELNGFDELCDPIGGEDYHLGLRIEWSGAEIHYRRSMLVTESEELATQPSLVLRHDKTVDRVTYMRRLREFGVRERSTEGSFDGGHLLLDILLGTRSLRTMGNYYSLRTLTEFDLPGTIARFPRTHWFDHRPLAQM